MLRGTGSAPADPKEMRYVTLATDYDGTLATRGRVGAATARALEHFVARGGRIVLVTGRQVDDAKQAFVHLDLFERVVAENGAVLYQPARKELRRLGNRPPEAFVDALRRQGVEPISVGEVIVATREPYGDIVLETIRQSGLDLHVETNRSAVMILPAGTTKGTGLAAALEDMQLSPGGVVGVGDAENDLAMLSVCGFAVSVANGLESVKRRSDWVTPSPEGAGVVELIERMVADDLPPLAPRAATARPRTRRARRAVRPRSRRRPATNRRDRREGPCR
jgi:hydroxymethylpyrimidine pyrophosphatase-like HAD family hydrolase